MRNTRPQKPEERSPMLPIARLEALRELVVVDRAILRLRCAG
jgi:hypothetical protein